MDDFLSYILGDSPQGGGGFEEWLTPPDLSGSLESAYHALTTPASDLSESAKNIGDVYHGAMGILGTPKKGIDELAGLGYDALGIKPAHAGNEAGQAYADILRKLDPTTQVVEDLAKVTGFTPALHTAEENVGGLVTDPSLALIPESKYAPLVFAPGAAEQLISGLVSGGEKVIKGESPQEDYTNAAFGGGMLGLLGLAHEGIDHNAGSELNPIVENPREHGTLGNQEGMVKNPFSPDEPDANIVFHGSPHNFDTFDLSKIGTGEGNQAYGEGFYHAEEPAIGGSYKENLSKDPDLVVKVMAKNILDSNEGNFEAAIKDVTQQRDDFKQTLLDRGSLPNFIDNSQRVQDYNKMIEFLQNNDLKENKGQLYVSAIPPEDRFLDYHKGIEDQPDFVKAAIPDIVQKAKRYEPNLIKAVHDVEATVKAMPFESETINKSLEDFKNSGKQSDLDTLVRDFDDYTMSLGRSDYPDNQVTEASNVLNDLRDSWHSIKPTSEARGLVHGDSIESARRLQKLKEGGVAGIKYQDAGSRGMKEGEGIPTHNYVVFDPKDIKILGKSAEPDVAALSAHVAEMKQKYGPRAWRKNMTEAEIGKFEKLLNESQGIAPKQEALPEESGIVVPDQIPPDIMEAQTPTVEPPKIEPPTPPETAKNEPPKPEPPVRLNSVSKLERATLPAEKIVEKIEPGISKAERAYRLEHETEASKYIGEWRDVTQNLDKDSIKRVLQFTNGEDIVLNKGEQKAAVRLRQMYDEIAAQSADLLGTKYRQDYYTHMFEDAGGEKLSSPYLGKKGTMDKPYGPLEKVREGKGTNIKYDSSVVEKYFDSATRRLAEAKHLGTKLEKVSGSRFKGDDETVRFVKSYLDQITGRTERGGPVIQGLNALRHVTALGDLGKAAISQLGQASSTIATTGLKNSLKSLTRLMKDYKGSELESIKSGALWPTLSHEVGKAISSPGYMHGVSTADKMMRVHANIAGELLARDARSGNVYAKRQLNKLGVDIKDPDFVRKAGKAIADKTQFRTGVADLPLWAHSPYGKLVTQYSSFAYAHARYLVDMFKNPAENAGQIARMAVMGAILGEGVSDTKALFNGIVPGQGEDKDLIDRLKNAIAGKDKNYRSLITEIQDATKSKRISWSSPFGRILQNLSQIGGLGIFQTMMEKLGGRDPKEALIGPAGQLATDTFSAARKDVENGLKFPKESVKNLIVNAPIPLLNNRKIANYIFPLGKRNVSFPTVNLP